MMYEACNLKKFFVIFYGEFLRKIVFQEYATDSGIKDKYDVFNCAHPV